MEIETVGQDVGVEAERRQRCMRDDSELTVYTGVDISGS
jgi:hypothetical protein